MSNAHATMVVQEIEEQARRHQGKCCRDANYTIMPNKSELYLRTHSVWKTFSTLSRMLRIAIQIHNRIS
jgi:hypothetical protein